MFVMPGHSSLPCADYVNLPALPGIHVLAPGSKKVVDGRDEPGHDEETAQATSSILTLSG
jgi:hypothetical protein